MRLSEHRREDGIPALQGFLDGKQVNARSDTEAERSTVPAFSLKQAGLEYAPHAAGQHQTLLKANGEEFHAVGQVNTPWRSTDELAQVYDHELLVFADVPFEIIIGNDFLQASETYLPRPQNALHVRTANILGMPSRRIPGKIDKAKVLALPDTGSEKSLVSHEYAKSRG